MDMPVKSKVEEIALRPHEFLLPLFEVVVNAIISIQTQKNEHKGLIIIEIERQDKLGMFEADALKDKNGAIPAMPIKKIIVTDNGPGFTDENFKSFNTAYSTRYKDRGCKGVGRFTMLACFQRVLVESVFTLDKGDQWHRSFVFDVENEISPADGGKKKLELASVRQTSVILENFLQPFAEKSAITTHDIAAAIIDHCFPFFVSKGAPTVIVKDPALQKELILNDILKTFVKYEGKSIEIQPQKKGIKFLMQIVRREDARMNRLRLCAHNRVVGKNKNLATLAPEFENPMEDADGNEYYIDVYVTSQYLNQHVNAIRNSFNIAEEQEDGVMLSELTIKDIEMCVLEELQKKYDHVFQRFQEETLRKVKRFILDPKKMRLRYRALLHRPDLLKNIPYNATNDRIEEHLIRIKIQLEKELRQDLSKVLKKTQPEDFEEYSEIVKKYIDQEAEFAKDKLADLVIHRKGVLVLLKRLLRFNKDKKYALEKDLHNVIFPMGKSTDDLPVNYHNLWLLDERLAFHSFVGSDKKLRSNAHVDLKSNKEADLLIFDFPWAFSEKERELSSMVVFEFKRPGRDVAAEGDKRIDSLVMKYFEDLLENKKRDVNGELLNLEDNTPKFGFIICDLDKDIIAHNTRINGFNKTPNGTLYKIIPTLNLHIEAMTYQQMISMSEKRHQAFFDELGLENE